MEQNKYNETFMTQGELEQLIESSMQPFDFNKTISAYEMAENIFKNMKLNDGSSVFFHVTRVARIIISELRILDHEIIISALLHDIDRSEEKITSEIITYNFGPYVAFLIEKYPDEIDVSKYFSPDLEDLLHEKLKVPGDDYLIIRLSSYLDMVRSLEYNPELDPMNYIGKILNNFQSIIECSSNKSLIYLLGQIKKERNRFLC